MDNFIEQLLNDQGIPADISPEVRQQLVTDLSSRATDFANKRLIESMDKASVEQFNVLLDSDSITPEQVQDFVTVHVADREKIVSAALYEFRTLYLGEKA